MNKFTILILLAAFALSACKSTSKGDVTNYQAPGNLASPNPSACVPINGLSNTQNPVEIFNGLARCIDQQNYTYAVELYFAGMAYGFFDTKRVSDTTAHQAISVLRMNTFGEVPQPIMDKLTLAITAISEDNSAICQGLSALGAPSYQPTYMIQHGIRAFTGQTTTNGLVENFDADLAWKEAMSTIAKCSS